MGTSTVHRSPRTTRWLLVNALYEDPTISNSRVLAEVFNAADQYPEGLAGLAVLERVEALLRATEQGDWRGGTEAALAAARAAVADARASALREGEASFYGDLADRAVHSTLVAGVRSPATLATAPAALTAFLGQLVSTAVDHLVARDLSQHLGRGRVTGAAEATALRRALVQQAHGLVQDERFAPAVEAAAAAPRQAWAEAVTAVWRGGTRISDNNDRTSR